MEDKLIGEFFYREVKDAGINEVREKRLRILIVEERDRKEKEQVFIKIQEKDHENGEEDLIMKIHTDTFRQLMGTLRKVEEELSKEENR